MRSGRSVVSVAAGLAAALGAIACLSRAPAADTGAAVTVTLETTAGQIDVTVYPERAPVSATDFLRYVDQGRYDGAAFYRAVRADNDRGTPKIEVIQGGILDESKALPPVAHETTHDTGITHRDGTVSLARGAPGTGGGSAFFICIGDQPALDFGGTRNADGLGFAAFGRVTHGMDVVRRIQAAGADGAAPSEYMKGQILSDPVTILSARRRH